MQVRINGQWQEVAELSTLSDLLRTLGFVEPSVAIAVNQSFVPRQAFAHTSLQARDDIEILAPMAGG